VNSDINDIVITIVPGVSVSGRIRGDEDSLPEATLNAVELTLQRTRAGGERGVSVVQSSALRPDGSFEFNRLTEGVDYRLLVAKLPPGLYVKQANRGNVDLLKESFQLYGSAADSIEVVLSSKGGQVEGVVTDEERVPVAKAQVVLVPVPADGQHHRFALTATDAAGQFAARNLAPGNYRVFAWRELEPFAYFDEELLQRFQDGILSIHVPESSLIRTAVRIMSQP
jgi:hypothetical protein